MGRHRGSRVFCAHCWYTFSLLITGSGSVETKLALWNTWETMQCRDRRPHSLRTGEWEKKKVEPVIQTTENKILFYFTNVNMFTCYWWTSFKIELFLLAILLQSCSVTSTLGLVATYTRTQIIVMGLNRIIRSSKLHVNTSIGRFWSDVVYLEKEKEMLIVIQKASMFTPI